MTGDCKIVLVVAMGENGVIGRNGKLPWRLKSELQHFKRVTLNHPVVMGRKTFHSLKQPLPERTNIVLTRRAGEAQAGVIYASDLDDALALGRADAKHRGVDALMVIGGSDVFARTLPIADRLELTRVHASPGGDVWFPALDEKEWRETRREPHTRDADDEFDYTIYTYERAAPSGPRRAKHEGGCGN
jgi:dihydrofolate reductase